MDLEIQFGELQQAEPQVKLRPDRNKHFAVAAVGVPGKSDLPVFVDFDALYDMEDHARSDVSVELGGVMLGGQYHDPQGRPFVVVTDCLRARHYEATKGSFKFTHDTWEQITRERDEFPDELQMVGWYHTHPGWGVFLSGMDEFICENFFNKPLDVALVIDPCQHDCGFFQWAGQDQGRLRRTEGFYLIASRFRQNELEGFATYLEGRYAMPDDPRYRGGAGGSPTPLVVNAGQANWQIVAVLGMLAIQFCFLGLLAWRLMVAQPTAISRESTREGNLAAIEQRFEELAEVRQREGRVDAKLQVLDSVVHQLGGEPEGVVNQLAEKTERIQELENSNRAHRALESQLEADLEIAAERLHQATSREKQLESLVESQQATIGRLEDSSQERLEELAEVKQRLSEYEDAAPASAKGMWHWTWVVTAALLGLLTGGVLGAAILKYQNKRETPEESSQESVPSGQ